MEELKKYGKILGWITVGLWMGLIGTCMRGCYKYNQQSARDVMMREKIRLNRIQINKMSDCIDNHKQGCQCARQYPNPQWKKTEWYENLQKQKEKQGAK